MRLARSLHLMLIACLLVSGVPRAAWAQDGSASLPTGQPVPAELDQGRASGLSVPLLKIPGRLTVDYIDDPKSVGTYFAETFKDPQTYVKIGSVLALSALTGWLAHAMPGPLFLRTAVGLSGAFVGWEIGKFDFANIDWGSQAAEVGAATGAYMLTQSLMGSVGLLAGGWAAGAAAVGAAVATHFLIHKVLKPHDEHDQDAHGLGPGPELAEAGVAGADDHGAAHAALRPGDQADPAKVAQVALASAWARYRADLQLFEQRPDGPNLAKVRASQAVLREAMAAAR